MAGKAIYWNGNQDNNPKSGVIAAVNGGNLTVRWDDGLEQVVPAFVVTPKHGWRVV